jgi:hypothetical protein
MRNCGLFSIDAGVPVGQYEKVRMTLSDRTRGMQAAGLQGLQAVNTCQAMASST